MPTLETGEVENPGAELLQPEQHRPARVTGDDATDRLLRQYDEEVGQAPAPAVTEPPLELKKTMDVQARLAIEVAEQEHLRNEKEGLKNRIGQLEAAQRVAAMQKQAGEDEARIMAAANEVAAEFSLPPDYAGMWLGERWRSDAELQKAVAGWYKSGTADAQRRAVHAVNRVLKDLREHARKLPDAHATEDRALVTRAVRGEGLSKAPAREKHWDKMSTREFKGELAELGIENTRLEG